MSLWLECSLANWVAGDKTCTFDPHISWLTAGTGWGESTDKGGKMSPHEIAGPSHSLHLYFFTHTYVPVAKVSQTVPRPGTGPSSLQPHLKLADPGAVPVWKASPLDKELPLRVALEWGIGQRVVWLAVGPKRRLGWQWRLTPRPVQNLLDFAFEWRALRVGNTGRCWKCLTAQRVVKQLKSREGKGKTSTSLVQVNQRQHTDCTWSICNWPLTF